MKNPLLILSTLGFTLAPLLGADETRPPTADALLQRILAEPGQYSQMCGGRLSDGTVPLPIYWLNADGELHVSAANLAALRARRAEIIPAVQEHLGKLRVRFESDPSVVFHQGAVEVKPNPDQLSGPLCEIMLGLDAVETLPLLLHLEEQIAGHLPKDAAAPADGGLTPRSYPLQRAKVAQRDLLSMMLQFLRKQRYQPVLDSLFEKTYAEALKAAATQEYFKGVKTPADAVAQGKPWVRFDPIYHLPIGSLKKLEVPFTSEVRAEVRGFAEQFLKTVPPEKWKVNTDES